ncbi:MAG: type IIL restriction-modification enzyme MmeI, partial [Gaiellaceae bacterium]
MAPSEDEIRRRLAEFAARWGGYQGSERAEAQTFLNQLLSCYGVDRQAAGARFEDARAGGFMDMFWPGVCIVEMKRPSEADRLANHRQQALEYWQRSGTPSSPAPRYVVLCAFHRFEVWEPGAVYTEPRAVVDLVDLPDQLDVLNFLAGRHPVFGVANADVTREAVALVTEVFQRLQERKAAGLDELRDFVLQSVWAMFAEDLHMLPSHLFTRVLQVLLEDPSRSSADDLGRLFEYLATPGPRPEHGLYEGTPYANGSLFTKPARVHLDAEEVEMLLLSRWAPDSCSSWERQPFFLPVRRRTTARSCALTSSAKTFSNLPRSRHRDSSSTSLSGSWRRRCSIRRHWTSSKSASSHSAIEIGARHGESAGGCSANSFRQCGRRSLPCRGSSPRAPWRSASSSHGATQGGVRVIERSSWPSLE